MSEPDFFKGYFPKDDYDSSSDIKTVKISFGKAGVDVLGVEKRVIKSHINSINQ